MGSTGLKTRRFKGFTLIELIVAMTIIAALILIAVPKFPFWSAKSIADADSTASAVSCWIECVNFYKEVKDTYPDSLNDAKTLGNCLCAPVSNLSYNNDSNGVYFCYTKNLNSIGDLTFIKYLKRKTGGVLNSSCPATTDSSVDVGQTAYLTVWLSK